jgi:hypothetical protein
MVAHTAVLVYEFTAQLAVQYATNLIPNESEWFTLSTNAPVVDGVGTAIDPAATNPQRFYRVGFSE